MNEITLPSDGDKITLPVPMNNGKKKDSPKYRAWVQDVEYTVKKVDGKLLAFKSMKTIGQGAHDWFQIWPVVVEADKDNVYLNIPE